MKRLLSCTSSEMLKMDGQELKQAILASEGRTVMTETVVAIEPLLGDLTNAELAVSFGSDMVLLNCFDCNNPEIKGLPECDNPVEKLKEITAKNLYEYYKELIDTCKIDIFVSGANSDIAKILENNDIIKALKERNPNYVKYGSRSNENKEKIVEEKMDVAQGKLVIGMDLKLEDDKGKYAAQVYNTILGGSASSKLFQNVREKASLAYTVSSNYMKLKSNIFIRAGIEIDNYEKALEIIKKQLEDMKNGDFLDEDIALAKRTIIATINNIQEEQDIELSYYYGQELSDRTMTIEEYKNNIEQISREDINTVANSLNINTIYFLRN